ncbi:MAG: hypothetical protein L6Q26_11100 [Anaerolineales bacterium]|nr:hypothetical protein [Anaerolineales bacterium]
MISPGKADAYRLAQLDDYTQIPRRRLFLHRFGKGPSHPLETSLSLSARTSSDTIPGTWGFGLWNDPFGLSIGFGGKPFRLPALPNAVWFFGASEENYLSFKEPPGFDTPSATQPAANGFLAQSFRAPRFHPLLILAGMALPFSRKWTRRLMSQIVAEDGVQLWSPGARSHNAASKMAESKAHRQVDGVQGKGVDPTQWHRYRLEWSPNRVSFDVDEVRVFESVVRPNPPLGLVIWIDNQYAAFTPEGRIGFGVLENPEPAWLEVKEVEVG